MTVICVIEFDNNPIGIYYAGQKITGKVTLQTEEVKNVKAIVLKVSGFAHISWSESSGAASGSRTTWYTGHEDYIKSITYLMGSNEGPLVNIDSGTYSYNFECEIPMTCPSSYEGLHGHIRYGVTVAFVRPWKFDNTFTRNFTLSKVLDLNCDSPLLYELATAEACNTFGFGPWKTNPLKMNVSIPQSGYLPGQIIPINVLINNESNVRVTELKVSLVMHVCYYSQYPYTKAKDQKIKVVKSKGEGVQCYCTKNYKYELLIPATPPTCVTLCSRLKITYELQVEAKVKGLHLKKVICVPVTIGNLHPSTVMQQQPISNVGGQSELFENSNASTSSNPVDQKSVYFRAEPEKAEVDMQEQYSYTDLPPPTFEEVVDQKSAELENLRDMDARCSEEISYTNILPPTFEEAVSKNYELQMPGTSSSSASNSSVDQKSEYSCFELGCPKDIYAVPIKETSVNVQGQLEYTNQPTAIFEEALHMASFNIAKNAFTPRYPVFRLMSGPIPIRAVECNTDLSHNNNEEDKSSCN